MAERHEAEHRHASELATAAAHLAERQAQHETALAHGVAARDTLARQLTDTGAALERAQQDQAAAAQRQTELEERLAREAVTRGTLERDLAETRLASEQAKRRFLDEAATIRQRVREHETRLEERAARERSDHESVLAETQAKAQQLQLELEALRQLLGTTQEQLQRLNDTYNQEQETHVRISREHAAERATLESLIAERDGQVREQKTSHLAAQQAAQQALTQIEEKLRLAREALRHEAERVPQLQKQLDESQKENRRQFERTPYGMCRCSLDGAVTHVNGALVGLLGYRTADELRKADFATAVFESADDLRWLIERCLNTGTTESVETTWRTKKGGRLVVRLLAVATAPESIEIVAEDITNLRAVEEKLRQAQRMEAVGRLASEVATTCDNLLRDVSQGGQQWLAAIGRDNALRHQGELLLGEVTRAASFLRQLSVYGEKQTSALEPVNVNRVLRDLEPVIKRVAGDEIALDLPKASPSVDVDVEVERVERILVNVASYARERMPLGGRLKIELAAVVVDRRFLSKYPNVRPGDHVLITVTEITGAGSALPPIGLHNEPAGANASRSASDKPGVDLGALLALINDCGGHLWMTAEPPGNMVLKIHLPKRVSDFTDARTPATRSSRGGSMARWFGH